MTWKRIVIDKSLWAAVVLAILTALFPPDGWLGNTDFASLASMGLTFGAIGFAAAVAGMGFTLALPGGERRIRDWSSMVIDGVDAYTALMTVFTYAGRLFAVLIVVSIPVFALGSTAHLADHRRQMGLYLFLLWYSGFFLFDLLRTIDQTAKVIASESRQS